MSGDTLRQKVFEVINTKWLAAYPTVPIKWENHKLDQPDTPWLDVDIRDAMDSERADLGKRYFVRKFGVVDIAVMVPEDTGTIELNGMIDTLDGILSEAHWLLSDGDSVTFENMVVRHKGLSDGYYYHRVIFGYTRSECKKG